MMKRIAIIAGLVMGPFSMIYAQQDTTLMRTVVVENEYNPTIMDASKVNVLPKIVEPVVTKKKVDYATSLLPVSGWNYEAMPAVIRTNMYEKAKRGHVHAAYGNRGNVDAGFGYIWDMSKKDRLAIDASFKGWNGEFETLGDTKWTSRFYHTDIDLGYMHRFKRMDFSMGASADSKVFNYLPDILVGGEGGYSLYRQNMLQLGAWMGLASTDKELPLQWNVQTGVNSLNMKHGVTNEGDGPRQTKVHTLADFWGNLSDEQQVGVKVVMDNLFFSNVTDGSERKNYTSLAMNPYYTYNNDRLRLRLGAHVDYLSGDGNGVDFAPDVKLEAVFADSYVFYINGTGGRELNDLEQMSLRSPYWLFRDPVASTYVPLDASLGLKGSPCNGFWFNLYGGYKIHKDYVFMNASFADPYITWEQNDLNALYLGADLKYDYKDIVAFSLSGKYYSWNDDSDDENKDFMNILPDFTVNAQVEAKIIDPLKVSLGYDYVKRYDGKLDPVSNLKVGASYEVLKDLKVFGRVENLLNKRYLLDTCYPVQKLNFLAGISYKF